MRNSKSTQATTEINKIQKTKIELQLKMNPRQMPNKKDLDFDFIITHILSHSNQIKFNIIRQHFAYEVYIKFALLKML